MVRTLTELTPPKTSLTLEELDLYRFFTACFSPPSRERFSWLSGKEFRALLKQLARKLEGHPRQQRRDRLSDYHSYESAYLALFEVGLQGPPVPLLESAHTSRAAPQEIVLECVNFYDVLGLSPSCAAFPPDHLVTQLEFLAVARYLGEREPDSGKGESLCRLERDFLARHILSWVPAAQKKLAELDPPLFPSLLWLLCLHARDRLNSPVLPGLAAQ